MKRWCGGSGISWIICKSFAPRSRQITTSVPHHSVFIGRTPFLPPNQQCQSTQIYITLMTENVNSESSESQMFSIPFLSVTPNKTLETRVGFHSVTNTQLNITQVHWFLWPDYSQFGMPPVRNARLTSCPILSSEHAQILNYRTRSISNLWTRPMWFLNIPVCSAPMSYLAGSKWGRRCATGTPQRVGACSEHEVLAAVA